jgi:peptidoglycan/LPS O-acetylase OafA/YrhL
MTFFSARPVGKRRVDTFDLMDFYRYIGAVLVALVHYILIYFPLDPAIQEGVHARLQPVLGLFFSMSGFVLMHVYDGRITTLAKYGDYMRKRLARMYPLFLVTFAVAYVWGRCGAGWPGLFAANAILPNLLLIHAWNTTTQLTFDYPSWSISAEIFVYMLFPVFLAAIDRLGRFAFALPLLLAIGVAYVFSAFALGDWTTATYNSGALRAVPSFVAGMIMYRLATGAFADLRLPAWVGHGMAIASLPLMLAGAPGELMLIYMAALVLVMALAEPEQRGVLSRPWARTLANASYGFYLLHALVAPVLLGALVRRLGLPKEATYALAPVAILVTTVLAIASFRYFEDPARRFLGSSRRKPARAPEAAAWTPTLARVEVAAEAPATP